MNKRYFHEMDRPDNMAAIGIDSAKEFHVVEIWKEIPDETSVRAYCNKIVEPGLVPLIPATAYLIGNLSPEKCCRNCMSMMALIVEQNLGDSTALSYLAYDFTNAQFQADLSKGEMA